MKTRTIIAFASLYYDIITIIIIISSSSSSSSTTTTTAFAPATTFHTRPTVSVSTPRTSTTHFSVVDTFQTFINGLVSNEDKATTTRRKELKSNLFELCEEYDGKDKRERVEDIMYQLAELSPTQNTATSPLLQNQWLLKWTTEKEINIFSDWGISGDISQTIDETRLVNVIPFRRGGSLSVKGELSIPNDSFDGIRTDFAFTVATLDLGPKWGTYEFPPIGKGWFDTIYLDEDLRIDTNSRNDILICTPVV